MAIEVPHGPSCCSHGTCLLSLAGSLSSSNSAQWQQSDCAQRWLMVLQGAKGSKTATRIGLAHSVRSRMTDGRPMRHREEGDRPALRLWLCFPNVLK